MTKTNKNLNQNQAVIAYLKLRRNAKMTAYTIAEGVKQNYGLKYTSHQVAKCLNKLKNQKVVKFDEKGMTLRGTPCYRWFYNTSK